MKKHYKNYQQSKIKFNRIELTYNDLGMWVANLYLNDEVVDSIDLETLAMDYIEEQKDRYERVWGFTQLIK